MRPSSRPDAKLLSNILLDLYRQGRKLWRYQATLTTLVSQPRQILKQNTTSKVPTAHVNDLELRRILREQ